MKLKELVENPEAAAILDKYIPGLTKNPQLKMGYGMTFRAIAKFPQAKIPKDTVDLIEAELQALE